MTKKPLILITNDDGIEAEGIHRLVDAVDGMGDLVVVAPDGPRSGGSASITSGLILKPKRHADYRAAQMWSLNGTPVDCVKLGLDAIVGDRRPELVLSGINHGSNTGNSVVYSGTMGAALEGCLQGITSVGFSLTTHRPAASDFDACLPVVRRLSELALREGLPDGVCLNVNMPKGGKIAGCRWARACKGRWTEEFAAYTSPSGDPFYMLTGVYENREPEATDTDLFWLSRGYASVVPTVPDRDYPDWNNYGGDPESGWPR